MILRLLGRLRSLYRPTWLVPAIIALYIMEKIVALWLRDWGRLPFDVETARILDTLVVWSMAYYGLERVKSFHPGAWTDYGRWLAQTPWRSSKPLPLGPVHLGLHDLIFVAVMTGLLDEPRDPSWNAATTPLFFLCGYLATLAVILAMTSATAAAYALAFGLGLVARLWSDPPLALGVAAALYPIGFLGLHRSLAGFPWNKPKLLNPPGRSADLRSKQSPLGEFLETGRLSGAMPLERWLFQQKGAGLGWPFDIVQPKLAADGIRFRDGLLISLLVGWWLYALVANAPDRGMQLGLLAGPPAEILLIAVVVRTLRYCRNYASPINFWGRVFTLRWIIPGYDKVFLAPVAALVVFGSTPLFCLQFGWDPLIAAPAFFAASVSLLLNGAPTLENWRRLGNHRIKPNLNRRLFTEI